MNPEITRHKAELENLCRRFRVRRLELVGSGAVGNYRPVEAIEQLFGTRVDLVVASAIKNPYFRQSARQWNASSKLSAKHWRSLPSVTKKWHRELVTI